MAKKETWIEHLRKKSKDQLDEAQSIIASAAALSGIPLDTNFAPACNSLSKFVAKIKPKKGKAKK